MRVLIAEDDTTSRLILEEILTQLGHDVVTAANGQEAWSIFSREHVPLLISDWMMPDLDGIELRRRIRAENRARYTYIILLTALGGKESYLEAMRAGADDFASKPLDADQLRARLRVAERILGLQRELVQLELSQQQIVQQERLRALGEMASGIAHDFSNAMTAVVGFSDMLMSPGALDDKPKAIRRLELIRTAGLDATDLVRRLREFCRPKDESEVFSAVDVNQAIRTAVALSEPRWKAQAQAAGGPVLLKTDFHEVAAVDGHASELRDVLLNLIFNAVDAMPQGGTLTIATEHEAPRTRCWSRLGTRAWGCRRRCAGGVRALLHDQGCPRDRAGTGDDLRDHPATRRHDRHRDAARRRNDIPYPIARVRRSAGLAATSIGGAVPRPLRILVVENEPVPRQVVVEYLQRDGHIVEAAHDGRDGLERFQGGSFDVVVTDRAMPGMNGLELAAAIGVIADPRPAVIMLSGFGAEEVGVNGDLPPGVDFLLTKPVTLDRLRGALGQLT